MKVSTVLGCAVFASSLMLCSAGGKGCETAWAKGDPATCFLDIPTISRWGWSNTIYENKPQTMELWAGAGQCKLSAGVHVGSVDVDWKGDKVIVKATLFAAWQSSSVSLYIGTTPVHIKNGMITVAPGLFPYQSSSVGAHEFVVKVEGTHEFLRLALHADVCKAPDTLPPTPAPTPEPVPTPDCVDAADTHVRVEQPHLGSDADFASPVVDGMDGWTLADLTPTLHDFYDVQLRTGMKAYFPHQNDALTPGKTFRIHCPANCDDTPCEVVLTVYHCPPCSTGFNGGYPGLLPLDGWAPGRCAPTFKQGVKHKMIGFYKQIPAGTVEELPETSAYLSNFAFFARTNAVDCSGFGADESACGSHTECKWEGGQCLPNWCPPYRHQQGPLPTCAPCAPVEDS